MSEFRYPVDTDQFAMIREKGLVYVDKTDLLFDLVNRYNFVHWRVVDEEGNIIDEQKLI